MRWSEGGEQDRVTGLGSGDPRTEWNTASEDLRVAGVQDTGGESLPQSPAGGRKGGWGGKFGRGKETKGVFARWP